jgi:hypothetical protein
MIYLVEKDILYTLPNHDGTCLSCFGVKKEGNP